MDRRKFLSGLGLLGLISCENDMSLFHSLLGSAVPTPDTTPDGKQLYLIVGDSIAAGRGLTAGPTASAGTVYEFTTSEVELTTADVSTASDGSPWKQFGITNNARTGKKPVFLCQGSGGSNIYPTGDNNDWYTTGTLRSPTETKVSAAFTNYNLTKLKGIIVILGINDLRDGTSRGDITTGLNSFITWLTTTWADTPIYVVNIGRHSSSSFNADICWLRKQWLAAADANTNIHIATGMSTFNSWGYYHDDLHPSQTGNNLIGNLVDRYISYETFTNKKVRTILSYFETELSSERRTLIDTFVSGQVSNGNWALLSGFQRYKNSTQNNALVDWFGLSSVELNGSPTFNANDNISTNGTSSYIATSLNPTIMEVEGLNDIRGCVHLKTNNNGTGANRCLFGSLNTGGTSSFSAAQVNTGNLRYRVHDAANTDYTGETVYGNNAYYEIKRTASNAKALLKNGSSVATSSQASVALASRATFVGARNNAGTADLFQSGDFEGYDQGKAVGFDSSAWATALDTLNDNW